MVDSNKPNATATSFLRSLKHARHRKSPFPYWLIEDALPDAVCDAIAGLPFAPPEGAIFDGRRESNNATRVFFTPANQARFPVCREVAQGFEHPQVRRRIERVTGTDLSHGRLRIEYCLDVNGFWLEPHVDIPVKLFTMVIYLNDSPELHDAGTDIYDSSPEHRLVATAPCEWNAGLVFIPAKDTWHGFTKRPIRGIRKSLIVNYVSPAWQSTAELA